MGEKRKSDETIFERKKKTDETLFKRKNTADERRLAKLMPEKIEPSCLEGKAQYEQ